MPQDVWMDICNAHPRADDFADHSNFLCDGSWPNALSATIHWRAWRAMNTGRTDALSHRFVQAADRALEFRAALAPEQYVWMPDAAAYVPRHWRLASQEVDVLVRQFETLGDGRSNDL